MQIQTITGTDSGTVHVSSSMLSYIPT